MHVFYVELKAFLLKIHWCGETTRCFLWRWFSINNNSAKHLCCISQVIGEAYWMQLNSLCFHRYNKSLTWISKCIFPFFHERIRVLWKPLSWLHPNCFVPCGFYSLFIRISVFQFMAIFNAWKNKESAWFSWHSELYRWRWVLHFENPFKLSI